MNKITIDQFLEKSMISKIDNPEAIRCIRGWLKPLEDSGRLNHLHHIVTVCEELWEHPRHFHYTRHGLVHSARIVVRIAEWLSRNASCALNTSETLIFIGAAYLHDVGMQCMSPRWLNAQGFNYRPEDVVVPGYDPLEKIRPIHHRLSAAMIANAATEAWNEDPGFRLDATTFNREADLMAVLSLHHCGSVGEVPAEIADGRLCHDVNPPARMMMLIHLLRIGDALDADRERLNHGFLTKHDFAVLPEKEQFHTLKHAYVSRIELRGIGEFTFHYVLPPEAVEIEPDVRVAVERNLREHRSDAWSLLNENGIAFLGVASSVDRRDASCPYSLTPQVRRMFRSSAQQRSRSGSPAATPKRTGRTVSHRSPRAGGPGKPNTDALGLGSDDLIGLIGDLKALLDADLRALIVSFPDASCHVGHGSPADRAAQFVEWAVHENVIPEVRRRISRMLY